MYGTAKGKDTALLRAQYLLSGTAIGKDTAVLRIQYAMTVYYPCAIRYCHTTWCYVLSGTDIRYGATASGTGLHNTPSIASGCLRLIWRCLALHRCYVSPGTDGGYAAMRAPGTDPRRCHHPPSVRGTAICLCPTTRCPVLTSCMLLTSVPAAICLRPCYAIPGTDVAYGDTSATKSRPRSCIASELWLAAQVNLSQNWVVQAEFRLRQGYLGRNRLRSAVFGRRFGSVWPAMCPSVPS
eukprot:3128795-Rhodomonas_salina.4